MALDRKSLGKWAAAATESLLRADRSELALLGDEQPPRESVDPPGSSCRYYRPGHRPHHIPAMRAGELRRSGDADPVRYVDHALVASASLVWDVDALPGCDGSRLVTRLDLERADGSALSLVTHDTRSLAQLEACADASLWLVPAYSVLFVPGATSDASSVEDREPMGWLTLSVADIDKPWLPCPVAPPKRLRS